MSFDESVRKHCDRLSPQDQARTGYYQRQTFEKSYAGLFANPKVRAAFGLAKAIVESSELFAQPDPVSAREPEVLEPRPPARLRNVLADIDDDEEPLHVEAHAQFAEELALRTQMLAAEQRGIDEIEVVGTLTPEEAEAENNRLVAERGDLVELE